MSEATVESAEESTTLPALYYHCIDVYNAMVAGSEYKKLDDGSEARLWTGMTTALITEDLRLSVPYYSSITRNLKRMGCIRLIRRGGGNSPSVWEVLHEPTEKLFLEARPITKTKRQSEIAALQQQVKDLASRVTSHDDALVEIRKHMGI